MIFISHILQDNVAAEARIVVPRRGVDAGSRHIDDTNYDGWWGC